ncbi:MAG: hypothetical protein LBM69_06830 [Lachnospiraceae bacterium]|jgi:hypothetical protein|nr:hypothetical protein [Lachnospiraceae bacterium]
MAIGPLEMTTISRSQDVTAVRHHETNKAFVDQANIGQNQNKEVKQMARQVHGSDNADWHMKKQDAKEKGSNTYLGDGGKKRSKQTPKNATQTKQKGTMSHGFDAKV